MISPIHIRPSLHELVLKLKAYKTVGVVGVVKDSGVLS